MHLTKHPNPWPAIALLTVMLLAAFVIAATHAGTPP